MSHRGNARKTDGDSRREKNVPFVIRTGWRLSCIRLERNQRRFIFDGLAFACNAKGAVTPWLGDVILRRRRGPSGSAGERNGNHDETRRSPILRSRSEAGTETGRQG